ncbi:MAG TPA: OmpH family outer membrane protein [Candidatus Sulfotelmatobacter sp.]|jgi:outer membrane protein|nr:OmpH family outer membrane protein [Candidatus Sulfotelmatobacter sp.]
MKKISHLILVTALMAFALSASAQQKIATVDMKKLFNGYYKTKMAQVAIDKDKAEASKDLRDMSEALDKAKDDYKQMLDQANDSAISADEREKRKAAAADAARDLNSRQVNFESYQRTAQSQLADKSQRMIGNLVTEIQKYVSDTAKSGGYAVVLDSSAASANLTPNVLYADPSVDITADVLARENSGAPVDFSKPAAGLSGISTNAP